MVYIIWVFQYNLKTELMKVIKWYKVNKTKIDHNKINENTKEKALTVTNERVVVAFSEIGCWYGFKAR